MCHHVLPHAYNDGDFSPWVHQLHGGSQVCEIQLSDTSWVVRPTAVLHHPAPVARVCTWGDSGWSGEWRRSVKQHVNIPLINCPAHNFPPSAVNIPLGCHHWTPMWALQIWCKTSDDYLSEKIYEKSGVRWVDAFTWYIQYSMACCTDHSILTNNWYREHRPAWWRLVGKCGGKSGFWVTKEQ